MTSLLHLVSEQTMQNLLPLLALKPKTVIQVRSADERFKRAAENLKLAVASLQKTSFYHDLSPQFFEIVIDEQSPSADQTRRKVGESLSLWPGAVVNLTGGTKPMSIGAYSAAAYQDEPVLYCDSQTRRFLSLNERRPLPKLRGFKEISESLTVESVLAAHGINPEKLHSVKPTEQQRECARNIHTLYREKRAEVTQFARRVRDQMHPRGRTVPKSDIDRVLAAGLPGPDNDTEHEYLSAAAKTQWITERQGKWFYQLTGNTLRKEDRVQAAMEINKALIGGWFELEVFESMRTSGRFGDLRTEVQSRDHSQQAIGETDILGIDLQQLGLVFVSCKLSDEFLTKPLEHVFATRHRALEFGGTFAQTIFCFREFRDPNKRRIFSDGCRVVRARMMEGEPDFSVSGEA
ncbi:MAG: DUF1887 family CARF protein [Verrucomicrobia bacterium]|nr:DUF1887 family CARF protein [Verrucomicrobiota bacterium]